LSFDTSFFRSNEVIFSLLPRNEQEARSFVANMVPFYYHQYGELLLQDIFEKEALERAKERHWNNETLEVISPDDYYLDKSGDIFDDYDILETMGAINTHSQQQPETIIEDDMAISRVQRLFSGEETDSIGSLFSNHTTGIGYKGPTLTTTHENDIQPGTGTASIGALSTPTTVTVEDIQSLAITMTSIQGMMQEFMVFKTKMEMVMENNNQQNSGNANDDKQNMDVDSHEPTKQKDQRKAADSKMNSRDEL
jgi:hypothetical protein